MSKRVAIALLMLFCLPGCTQNFWVNRGPVGVQRAWAEAFDPYPEPDIAPELEGVRPEGFENPPAEPLRARNWPSDARRPY